jgi:hypothetical protein
MILPEGNRKMMEVNFRANTEIRPYRNIFLEAALRGCLRSLSPLWGERLGEGDNKMSIAQLLKCGVKIIFRLDT